jgi:4-amino-4-deoxy-L-arabinose transferase-like glycosyltransferase
MRISKFKSILFPLITIFLYVSFIVVIRFKPITQTFEFDSDEGLNLIKVLLYSQGFSLYTQIWNDQPPLFTVILSLWFSLVGQSIIAARLLILIFSALLMWCFYQIIRRELGTIPALIATILLLTSWLFIRISISVMIGIPSLSLAMSSIYFLALYKQNCQRHFLILSGAFLALSLQTKLFNVFLIPLVLFSICDYQFNLNKLKIQAKFLFNTFAYWLGSFGIVYTLIFFLYKQFYSYDQVLKSHLDQPIQEELVNFDNFTFLTSTISQDYDYMFLGFIGILAIFWKKQKNGIFPLIWLVAALLILLNHKPIWYHHYPLLAIPICWLAAYGVALVLEIFAKSWHQNLKLWDIKRLTFSCLVVGIMIFLIIATPPKSQGIPPKNLELMQLVLKYKDSTQWLFTDRPIYAFYANLPIPPEIAIMSYKRFNSGRLSSKEILTVLEKYRPEQIAFARWTYKIKSDSKIRDYIDKNYSKTYTSQDGTEEHYILSINK